MTDLEQRIRAYVESLDTPPADPNLSRRLSRSVRRRRIGRAVGGALAIVSTVGAVGFVGVQISDGGGNGAASGPALTEAQARHLIVEGLSEPNVDPIAPYADDATDYLPNRLFAVGNQPAAALSDRVVVADVTDVVEGEAYTAHNEPVDDWSGDFFGYKTVIVQLNASPLLGDGAPEIITASLRVSSSATLETWRTGLRSFSPLVAFLTRGSRFDDADYTLAGDGVTLLPVGDDGSLNAPFRANWLNIADTLDELQTEARRPTTTDQVPGGFVTG